MANNKQIAKNTMYLYIRMFLVMLVSLYTVRVVISILGVVDYGIFSAVGGIVLMMSFLSSTITSAAQRYFSFELGKNNLQRLRRIFNSVLVIYVLTAVVIALIAEFAGIWFLENKMIIPEERMTAAHWVLHFSLLSFIVSILYTPFNAMIIAHENMKVYAYISIIEVFLKLGIVYVLLLSIHDKLILYSVLLFCASIIIALIYIGYAINHYKETHLILSFEKQIYSELIGYSSWTMFGTLAGAANQQGVGLLLNSFFGPVANASHSVANQVSHALQLFGINIFAAIRPPMTKLYAQGQGQEVKELLFTSTKYTLFLLLLIMMPIYFEMNYILILWLGEVSGYMLEFSRLALIYVMVLLISYPLTIVAQAANRVKQYHGIIDSFVLLTLLFSYCFLRYGYNATFVYWVMIIMLVCAHSIRLYIVKSIISFSYREYYKKSILPFMEVAICATIAIYYVHSSLSESFNRLLIVSIVSTFVIFVMTYFVGVNSHERNKIISYIKERIK